jgi:ribosomal protein S18 acetylase RimI-like enzyme
MELSERIAVSLCMAWRRRTAALGGTLHENDGVLSCLTGLDAAPFNPSLVERAPTDVAAALAAAERVYDTVGLPFGIDLDPALHPDVRNGARDADLYVVESRPGMVVAPTDVPAATLTDGLVIGRADGHLTDVAAVATAGFGGDPATNRAFVADAVFQDTRARVYLAWLEGRPVSTVETSLQDGILCVFGVATVPDARRVGIGAAITAYGVRDRAAETDLAFLQSSEMGHGVYERLGFRDVSTWEVWARGQ